MHILESFSTGRKLINLNTPTVLSVILLLFFANATFVLSCDIDHSREYFENFYKAVLLYILIANIIKTKKQFHGYLLLLAGCTFFLAYRVLNYGVWSHKRVFIYGSQLVTTDPNFLALVIAYSIPLVVVAFMTLKSRKKIIVILIFAFISLRILQGFVMTESRGGFLGLVVGGMVAFLLIKGVKKKAVTSMIALPFVILFCVRYIPMDYYYRMQEIIHPETDATGSAMVRANTMTASFDYIVGHPFSSYGLGNHSYLLQEKFDAYDWYEEGDIFRGRLMAHSFLLQIGADSGSIPLVFYMGFIGSIVWQLKKIINFSPQNTADQELVLYAKALLVSIAILCSGGFFLPMGYKPFVFYMAGITSSLYSIFVNQKGTNDDQ